MINSLKKSTPSVFSFISFVTVCVIFFTSCSPLRTTTYFRNVNRDTVLTIPKTAQEELKIQKGDILALEISSLSKEEDNIYNSSPGGYEVDNNGDIHIHHLGKINVIGLTRKELKARLESGLKDYLKDPVASVSFANHHVTILGSVGSPQKIMMPAEKLSIIDVLASSGAVNASTQLSRVLVIRDSSIDKKQLKYVNMEDHSIFTSDFYYLKPNDVVVVKPDEENIQKEQKRLQYQQISSVVLQFITIGLLVYNTFFRN